MNLHGVVRGPVNAVNPDIQGLILRSAGYSTATDGKRYPKYLQAQSIWLQVQAIAGGDLRHVEFLNLQGVLRAVYLFGDTQGVMRVAVKGGDLLQFPEYPGAPTTNWLVTEVLETWNPGWSKVIATQQVDPIAIV
jgi:hypothetical protein